MSKKLDKKFPNCVPFWIGPDNNDNKLWCTPRIREPYDKQYTFGVDRKIQNFKNCGYIYYQKLPPMCPKPVDPKCHCKRSFYDANPRNCKEEIAYDKKLQAKINKQIPQFRKPNQPAPNKRLGATILVGEVDDTPLPKPKDRSIGVLSYEDYPPSKSNFVNMSPKFKKTSNKPRKVNRDKKLGILSYENYPSPDSNFVSMTYND